MAEKDIGTLKDYVTLDDAAMTLARMRMRRAVRNAPKEFLLRFFDAGAASANKCRAREGMLCKVWSSIAKATEDGCLPNGSLGDLVKPPGAPNHHGASLPRRYKGKPFSYCGFLEKAARPTNMRSRRRLIALPYSEL